MMDAGERRALVSKLRRGPRGWGMLLPREAGEFQGKRIAVEVRHSLSEGPEPPLTDKELKLIGQIFEHLPKLLARAEREFEEAARTVLDEENRLGRPQIWIDREDEQPGRWTLVAELADSAFAWHIVFVGTKFQEMWAAG